MKPIIFLFFCATVLLSTGFAQSAGEDDDLKPLSSVYNCQDFIQHASNDADRMEMEQDYWILLGILGDLSTYRVKFVGSGDFIDLFPTAYYHTTLNEMRRIVSFKYTYPIEKMRQMIAFYDAYKFNRQNWDDGNKAVVEPHWKAQFEFATGKTADRNVLCARAGQVLATGVVAHVRIDLPRALKYTFAHPYDPAVRSSDPNLLKDFKSTDSLFKQTVLETINDIIQARSGCTTEGINILGGTDDESYGIKFNNYIYNNYPVLSKLMDLRPIFNDADVIKMRATAWQEAATGAPIKGWNGYSLLGQPRTDHTKLMEVGKETCPDTSRPRSGQSFTIDPKDVTQPTDKAFKWYDWDKAPKDIKIAAGYQKYDKTKTLADQIAEFIKEQGQVRIAAADLNADGVCGLVVQASGTFWCGSAGCTVALFDNGGVYTVELGTDYEPKPSKNGVMSGSGRFFPLTGNGRAGNTSDDVARLNKLFAYDRSKLPIKPPQPIDTRNLLGSPTPEGLGRLLLKAIQTNDTSIWRRCINPTTEPVYRQRIMDYFTQFRDIYEQRGLSHWNQVVFSRVLFTKCQTCQPPGGETLLTDFQVEFWYQNKEFLGGFAITRVLTYQGKYFMDGCLDCGANLIRNDKR